ncbi:MAG: TlpA disulfide reductase family protein [Sulfurospirillum sp.]
MFKKIEVKKFLETNDPYIAFSLPTLRGGTIDTKNLEGKVLFINFWATWCAPCKEEMPSMQALYNKLNAKYPNQFEMLAVNIDTQDVPLTVQMYALDLKLKFPILLDTNGTVKNRYNTTGVPETFIVDKKGKIFRVYIGAVDWNKTKTYKEIESLFK